MFVLEGEPPLAEDSFATQGVQFDGHGLLAERAERVIPQAEVVLGDVDVLREHFADQVLRGEKRHMVPRIAG
jgi:hypothetical protein